MRNGCIDPGDGPKRGGCRKGGEDRKDVGKKHRTDNRTHGRSESRAETQQQNTQQQKQQSAGLTPLSADAIESVDKPQPGGEFTDPAYGTHVHRATAASDGEGGRMRHEYSRRQAFNADNSRYLAQDGRGAWYLYDGKTFRNLGAIETLAGDCEPIWHPTDPSLIYFTDRNGGTTWWTYNTTTKKKDVVFDFTGKTPWPDATSYWTKGEGTTSADGRYLSLMATSYNESTKEKKIYGLLTLDIREKKIVGTLDAKDFPRPRRVP